MKDYLNIVLDKIHAPQFIKTLVDHNRGLFVGLMLSATLAISAAGCQLTTPSPVSGKPVTREQLDAEASIAARDVTTQQEALIGELQRQQAALAAKAADLKDKLGPAYADLQRKQDALNAAVGVVSGLINQAVPGPWQGVAATGMAAMLLGLGLDNRRKDALLASTSGAPPTP